MKVRCGFNWIFYDDINYHLDEVPGYFFQFCCEQSGIRYDDYCKQLPIITDNFSLFAPYYIDVDVEDEFTIASLVDIYLSEIGINNADFYDMNITPSILTLNECIDVDYSVKAFDVLSRFECGDTLIVCFFLSVLQGVVFRTDGCIYYMHSNEPTKHNLPHIHVCKPGDFDVTIDFLSLKLLDGNISTKKLKKVMETISRKQQLLIDHWNNKTNGITINVDYTLKYY